MRTRIVHLALAEGRGHLVRAHRLRHLLSDVADSTIVTTNRQGALFLRALGTPAHLLPGAFSLPYDACHVLDRGALVGELARYVASGAWIADRACLDRLGADLVLVDSFHPAAMVGDLSRTVFVHGDTMEEALLDELDRHAPPLAWMTRRALRRARACVHHSVAPRGAVDRIVLPPLLAPLRGLRRAPTRPLACVYLNPHHRDERIADAIERSLRGAFELHLVGEGFAHRRGWRATDPDLHESLAHASLLVSSGGMAALAEALRFQTPMVALEGDQPEQRRNLDRVAEAMGARLARVSLRPEDADLATSLRAALAHLPIAAGALRSEDPSPALWRSTFHALVRSVPLRSSPLLASTHPEGALA